jgi:hypothetical protein
LINIGGKLVNPKIKQNCVISLVSSYMVTDSDTGKNVTNWTTVHKCFAMSRMYQIAAAMHSQENCPSEAELLRHDLQ